MIAAMAEPETLPYPPDATPTEGTVAQQVAWALYDWANSGYGMIVTGVLFQSFFIGELLPALPEGASKDARTGLVIGSTVIPGSAVIALMTACSALLVVFAAPVLGAVADIKGWTKRLFTLHVLAGCALSLLIVFLGKGDWAWAIPIYVLSAYCFSGANTFYNAFLPRLARPERQGRLSGWGFACGYVGGAVALIVAAFAIARPTGNPALGAAFAGVWWLVFSLPALVLLKELPPVASGDEPRRGSLIGAGFRRVAGTFRNIRRYRVLFLFLLAFLLYANGTDTVINLSPAFGKEVIGMTTEQLTTMFLIVQFIAFVGATVFGYVADRYGNKVVIVSNLVVWVLAATSVMFITTPPQFQVAAGFIGVVLGGVQASSRSLMAKLAPREIHNEAFGFFSLSGKAVSVLGPLIYAGTATLLSPRYAVLSVLPFLFAGLVLVLFVREPRATETRAATV
jgi:UMF1 family MFS transporter